MNRKKKLSPDARHHSSSRRKYKSLINKIFYLIFKVIKLSVKFLNLKFSVKILKLEISVKFSKSNFSLFNIFEFFLNFYKILKTSKFLSWIPILRYFPVLLPQNHSKLNKFKPLTKEMLFITF